MALNKDFVYFVVAGVVLFTVPFFIIAWFQAGFFIKWVRVRASRGKLTLCKMRGKMRDFWEVGEIKGTFIIYGNKQERRRAVIGDSQVYNCMGVSCIDIDETTNAICDVNYQAVEGFDAEKYEGLYVRALVRPLLDENPNRTLIILLIIVIAAIAVVALMVWNVSNQISGLAPATMTTVL